MPAAIRHQAYENKALPIGLEQTISQPFVVALMTQALDINERDKVLEIGTGSGYQATVLSHLCRRVYTIERHRPLLEMAERRFDELRIRNITAIAADGMKGWPEQAPFNRIMLTAAATHSPPQELLNQLADGGVLVTPVQLNTGEQVLRRYRKESDDTFAIKDLCDVRFVPLLPNVVTRNTYTEGQLREVQS